MAQDKFTSEPDFTKSAADHLRVEAEKRGLQIGSSHAHALVAAWLGYDSRVALLAPSSNHYTGDPWLYNGTPDQAALQAAIARMRQTSLQPTDVPFLAQTIQDGLAPACVETGLRSAQNRPVGYIHPGEEASDTEWVHPSTARDQNLFRHCPCCGSDYLYRVEDLDEKGLCQEHKGEFDHDSSEDEQDWVDYIDNLTKDL